jgi:glutaredoxin
MYYADWCPHCVKAKPEFDALGSTQTIAGKKVLCQKFEYEAIQKEGGEAWKHLRANSDANPVSGFPTIRLYDSAGTMISEYAGDRTKDGFLSFLKETIQ